MTFEEAREVARYPHRYSIMEIERAFNTLLDVIAGIENSRVQ